MMQMEIYVIGRRTYIINQDSGTEMLSFDLIGREHCVNLGINIGYDTEIQWEWVILYHGIIMGDNNRVVGGMNVMLQDDCLESNSLWRDIDKARVSCKKRISLSCSGIDQTPDLSSTLQRKGCLLLPLQPGKLWTNKGNSWHNHHPALRIFSDNQIFFR